MTLITGQQRAFLDAFGFLRIEKLFADEVTGIIQAVESSPPTAGPDATGSDSWFTRLAQDDRVVGIAQSALGNGVECTAVGVEPVGCRAGWHADDGGGSGGERHLVVSLVIHPLHGDSGVVRVIPGTHHSESSYAQDLQDQLQEFGDPGEAFGVDSDALPATALEGDPGDVLVWDGCLIHETSVHSGRAGLLSVGFRARSA
jgi:hypothetical protein